MNVESLCSVVVGHGLSVVGSYDAIKRVQNLILLDSPHPVEKSDIRRGLMRDLLDMEAAFANERRQSTYFLNAVSLAFNASLLQMQEAVSSGDLIAQGLCQQNLDRWGGVLFDLTGEASLGGVSGVVMDCLGFGFVVGDIIEGEKDDEIVRLRIKWMGSSVVVFDELYSDGTVIKESATRVLDDRIWQKIN